MLMAALRADAGIMIDNEFSSVTRAAQSASVGYILTQGRHQQIVLQFFLEYLQS